MAWRRVASNLYRKAVHLRELQRVTKNMVARPDPKYLQALHAKQPFANEVETLGLGLPTLLSLSCSYFVFCFLLCSLLRSASHPSLFCSLIFCSFSWLVLRRGAGPPWGVCGFRAPGRQLSRQIHLWTKTHGWGCHPWSRVVAPAPFGRSKSRSRSLWLLFCGPKVNGSPRLEG